MDAEQLIHATTIVELPATSRAGAIRALIESVAWPEDVLSTDDIFQAIEDRESTAQTIVTEGLALPHAAVKWDGDFRILLGRSCGGVEYVAAGGRIHLVALIVFGTRRARTHLEILASVAELLRPDEFRQALVQAEDARQIERLLRERVGLPGEAHLAREPPIPGPSLVLVEQAVQMTRALNAEALLLVVERAEAVPWGPLADWAGRLLLVVAQEPADCVVHRPDTHWFVIPHTRLSRMDQASLGLLLATSDGLLDPRAQIVCVTGPDGLRLDNITVTQPAPHLRAIFSSVHPRGAARIPPAVLLRVLSLAIEVASEGREGRPVGTMFVVGDSRRVVKQAQQLVLNPFHGYSRRLRNVLDPSLAETIKEFATLDGAFVVQADGTALTAGTYLVSQSPIGDLPGGLGARHQAAAAITAQTRAVAITVSQSTGTVTVFQQGSIVLTLQRAGMTRW